MGGGSRSEYGDRPGPKGFRTVVVDAGHGGHDSGARSHGHTEKEFALDIANKLRSELPLGYKTVMVRDGDNFVDLDDRVAFANRYPGAILISVHLNYAPSRVSGPEVYYWRSDSYSLAKRLQRNLSGAAPHERGNRGLVRRRLRLTRNPQIPSVLVECGYLTSSKEGPLLADPQYRSYLAKAMADAIKEQSRNGDAGMGPIPPPIIMPPSKASDPKDRP